MKRVIKADAEPVFHDLEDDINELYRDALKAESDLQDARHLINDASMHLEAKYLAKAESYLLKVSKQVDQMFADIKSIKAMMNK